MTPAQAVVLRTLIEDYAEAYAELARQMDSGWSDNSQEECEKRKAHQALEDHIKHCTEAGQPGLEE